MPKGMRTQREYQSALDAAVFGRYEAEVFTDVWNELIDLRTAAAHARHQVAVAQELAQRSLAMDTEIPEGAEGRDKAFRLLENWSANYRFIAGHLTSIKAALG